MKKVYIASHYNKVNNFKEDIRYNLTNGKFVVENNDEKIIIGNYEFIGAFYYNVNKKLNFNTKEIVEKDLSLIDKCDIFIGITSEIESIGTTVEAIHAASRGKKTIIFIKEEETKYDLKSRYWFLIRMLQMYNDNIEYIVYNENNELINKIKYILGGK